MRPNASLVSLNPDLINPVWNHFFSTHTISGLKVFFKVGLKYSIKYNSTSYRNVPGTKFVYNYKTLLSSDSNVSFPWFKTEINGIYSSINRAMVNIYLLLQ